MTSCQRVLRPCVAEDALLVDLDSLTQLFGASEVSVAFT